MKSNHPLSLPYSIDQSKLRTPNLSFYCLLSCVSFPTGVISALPLANLPWLFQSGIIFILELQLQKKGWEIELAHCIFIPQNYHFQTSSYKKRIWEIATHLLPLQEKGQIVINDQNLINFTKRKDIDQRPAHQQIACLDLLENELDPHVNLNKKTPKENSKIHNPREDRRACTILCLYKFEMKGLGLSLGQFMSSTWTSHWT